MVLVSLVLKYAKPYVRWILAVVVLQLISTIAALYLPSLNAQIIDKGVSTGDTDFIWSTGMTMLTVCLVQVVSAIAAIYFGARTAMALGRDLRRGYYRTVDSLSALELSRFGTATLITRGTNDVQQVQMLVLMTLNFMVSTPIMCVGGIIMALREDAGLSWLVWVSVPALFLIVGFLVYLLMPLFRQDAGAHRRHQRRAARADRRNPRRARLRARTLRGRALPRGEREAHPGFGARWQHLRPHVPLIEVLNVATAAVLWFGGQRVDAGEMQVGSLTAFLQYLLQILTSVMMGVFMVMMIPRAVVCAERIQEVLGTRSSQEIDRGPTTPVALRLYTDSAAYAGANPIAGVMEGVVAHADSRRGEIAVALAAGPRRAVARAIRSDTSSCISWPRR